MSKSLQRSLAIVCSSIIYGFGFYNLFNNTPHAPAFYTICIFLASIILWLFVATDWTSLLTILAIAFIPEFSFTKASQLAFGNTTFGFLLFTFIVTYALNQTVFLKRLTHLIIQLPFSQKSTFSFLACFLVAVLVLSSFLSPTVTFMFIYPLYEEIVTELHWKKGDKRASYLLIALFSSVAIGTAMTPINHVFAITALTIYQQATQLSVSYLQYMAFSVPAGLLLFTGVLFWLKRQKLQHTQPIAIHSLEKLPKMTKREKWIVSLFFAMIMLWLFPELLGNIVPNITAFFKSSGLLFPPLVITILLSAISVEGAPLVNLPKAFTDGVHWQSMLLVSATLALGSVVSNPTIGIPQLVQQTLLPILSQFSPHVLVFILIAWASIQTNLTSNLVTVSLVTTILMTLNIEGINYGVLSSLIGFVSSVAVMTAPAMPYVAISIGTGWTNTKDCLTFGGAIVLFSIVVVTLFAYPLGLFIM